MSSKYLNPEAIARLKGVQLRARTVVAGVLSGLHRSLYRGYSVEFAEHRQYVPGDDIRHVDWRLFGRKDRLYIKQYEEETNLACCLVVDASASMAYGSGALSKFDYAATLAGGLAYLLAHQQDSVGLMTFDARLREHLPPASGAAQLAALLKILESTRPAEQTDVKLLLHRLAGELRRRSIVILLSDLLAPVEEIIDGLERLSHAGHELVVMHVLDRDEWEFPFHENVMFEGMEETDVLLADTQSLRRSYLEAVDRFATRVRGACLQQRADYVRVSTHEPLDAVLSGYLARRQRRGGGRR